MTNGGRSQSIMPVIDTADNGNAILIIMAKVRAFTVARLFRHCEAHGAEAISSVGEENRLCVTSHMDEHGDSTNASPHAKFTLKVKKGGCLHVR